MGFFSNIGSGCEWIICGLGNPEPKYDNTRHNAGFAAIDFLSKTWNISMNKSKFKGLYGIGNVEEHKVILLKPLTYMNLSGECLGSMACFYKVPIQNIIVLCDDITQAPGKLRIRKQGSAGGHNGLKSIIQHLGGQDFPRIRIGVGEKPHPEMDLADWVLGHFTPEQSLAVESRFSDIAQASLLIMKDNLEKSMSKFNG